MLQEIYDVIKSKLPEEVGTTLRKALEEAERNKSELDTHKRTLAFTRESHNKAENEIRKLKANAVTNKELDEREVILKNAEIKMVGFQLNERYEAEKRVNDHLMKIQELLCKSTTYRRIVQNFQDHAYDNQGARQSAETGREEIVTEE